MKIRMLRNPARGRFTCDLCEGEIGDVPADVADELIKANVAEPATKPKAKPAPAPTEADK